MSSSPITFIELPPELKCRIMINLDGRSIVNMSLTCKSINETIYASEALVFIIDRDQSELLPIIEIQSPMVARKFIRAHIDARLGLPIATRTCHSIPAPDDGILMERLFMGLFACITEDDTLHVWNIRRADRPPEKILMITEPNLMDVVIEPYRHLLVLLCYQTGDDSATIKLLDLRSKGTRPHPKATSHAITHRLLPEDVVGAHRGQQLLTLRGELLAFVYYRDHQLDTRRGIIWGWRTGHKIYDSMDSHLSSTFHDLLLLAPQNMFLVTVSTFLVNNSGAALGAWIELRNVDFCGLITTPVTRLVAEFHLPEFEAATECYLGSLDFYSSEPANWVMLSVTNGYTFPFVYNPDTSVHVLHIWYKPRPEADTRQEGSRVYLVISNRAFANVLEKWVRRNDPNNDASFPLRNEWDEWAPWWTSMWTYEDLGMLTATSSVSGSRICTVSHPEDPEECIELLVVDFNMNFPCSQRNCSNPLAHFYPKTFLPGDSPWARVVRTWLPYHTHCKRFTIKHDGDERVICTTVLMDEERIVFSTYVDLDPLDPFLDPTSWEVIHLIREQSTVGGSGILPLPNDVDMDPITLHDQICRLCKGKPHTDAHILLECTAHPKVVELRRSHLAPHGRELQSMWSRRSLDELFKEVMARRGAIRMSISSLAIDIEEIYEALPECSELVLADRDNPASILFVTQK